MTALTHSTAVFAADAAANVVWSRCGAPGAFRWRDALPASETTLAQFLALRREATAEQLYTFAVAGETAPPAWREIPVALRVALEVFRGTFLVLLAEIEAKTETSGSTVAISYLTGSKVLPIAGKVGSIDYGAARATGPGASDATTPSPKATAETKRSRLVRDRAAGEVRQIEKQWDGDSGRPAKRRKP